MCIRDSNVIDDHTVAFKLEDKNVAFLDYMTMAALPKHLLEGEDMQTSDIWAYKQTYIMFQRVIKQIILYFRCV